MKYLEFYCPPGDRDETVSWTIEVTADSRKDGASSEMGQLLQQLELAVGNGIKLHRCATGQDIFAIEEDKEELLKERLAPIIDRFRQIGKDTYLVPVNERQAKIAMDQKRRVGKT